MRRTKNVVAAMMAVGVALVVPGVASAAAPPKVRCNMLVTEDLTLTANVFCATGTGFRLADGVTLDLNGFRVRGTTYNKGVVITGTATVINGTLQGWTQAVWLDSDSTEASVVKNVVVNDGHVEAGNGAILVQDSTFNRGSVYVSMADGTVEGSTFTDSAVSTFMSDVTIKNNTFVRSGVSTRSGHVTVSDSTFDGGGLPTYAVGCSDGVLDIHRTSISHHLYGVMAPGCLRTLEDSVLAHNTTGLDAYSNFAPQEGDPVPKVRRNIFESNETGASLATSVEFTDNVLTDNGIGVKTSEDWIRTISGNTVTSSTGTGIVGGWPQETLSNNTVTAGGGQGIVAIGSIDGGGNVASANAVEPQCEGVVCSEN